MPRNASFPSFRDQDVPISLRQAAARIFLRACRDIALGCEGRRPDRAGSTAGALKEPMTTTRLLLLAFVMSCALPGRAACQRVSGPATVFVQSAALTLRP